MGMSEPALVPIPSVEQPGQRLPPELVDDIFCYLTAENRQDWRAEWPRITYNKRDLNSCALVCREWHVTARSHLFHDIAYLFRTDTKCDEACSRCAIRKYNHFDTRKTVYMLHGFLQANPGVAACIRRLRLEASPGKGQFERLIVDTSETELLNAPEEDGEPTCHDWSGVEQGRDWDGSDYLTPALFLSIVRLCPHLHSLSLVNVFLDTIPSLFPSPALPSLSKLCVQSNRPGVPETSAIALLACFSQVNSVVLDRAEYCVFANPLLDGPLQLTIKDLRVANNMSNPFFAVLRSTPTIHTLRSLDVGNIDYRGYLLSEMQNLLRDTASTLTDLAIRQEDILSSECDPIHVMVFSAR